MHIFNSEILLSTFILLLLELTIFIVQLFHLFFRPKDKSRLRFSMLTGIFIFYTLTSIQMPDSTDEIETFGIAAYSFLRGCLLGVAYFIYIIKETEIPHKKLFNVRLYGIIAFFLLSPLLSYLFTGKISVVVVLGKILPILLIIYVYYKMALFLTQKTTKHAAAPTPFKAISYSAIIGFSFICTMPISVIFGDLKFINVILVNVAFLLTAYAYLRHYMFQSKIEFEVLKQVGFFESEKSEEKTIDSYELTSREIEISYLMLQGLSYGEISEDLFITRKTVSKHASNIFKKVGCSGREAFMSNFGG